MRFVSQLKGKEPKENQVLHGKIYIVYFVASNTSSTCWNGLSVLDIVVTFCNYRKPNIYRPGWSIIDVFQCLGELHSRMAAAAAQDFPLMRVEMQPNFLDIPLILPTWFFLHILFCWAFLGHVFWNSGYTSICQWLLSDSSLSFSVFWFQYKAEEIKAMKAPMHWLLHTSS